MNKEVPDASSVPHACESLYAGAVTSANRPKPEMASFASPQAVDANRLNSIDAKLDAILSRTNVAPWPQFLTVERAAAYSGLSEKSVRRLISRGDLQPLRPVRGRLLVHRQALDALILSSTGRIRKGRGMK